jgi:hypothetical protein
MGMLQTMTAAVGRRPARYRSGRAKAAVGLLGASSTVADAEGLIAKRVEGQPGDAIPALFRAARRV